MSDPDPQASGRSYRFSSFVFATAPYRLLRGGRALPLASQPARLLGLLLAHAGEVVSREAIREHLWGHDTYVDFERGINVAVRQIRRVLDDDFHAPRYVETLPRHGYRFVAPVERVEPAVADLADAAAAGGGAARVVGPAASVAPAAAEGAIEEAAPPIDAATRPADSRRRRSRLAVPAVAVALVLLVVSATAYRAGSPETRGEGRPSSIAGAARAPRGAAAPPSLAVLPMATLGGRAAAAPGAAPATGEGYLGAGLTDELITLLGRRFGGSLRVIAPTSVLGFEAGRGDDPLAFGRRLGADHLLTGSVATGDGRVRVRARLTRTADGLVLWSGTYERPAGNLLAMQEELAAKIGEALALQILPGASSRLPRPRDPAAYTDYLAGRRDLAAGRPRRASEELARATRAAPGFAPGWLAYAQALQRVGLARDHRAEVEEALRHALALDDASSEAHRVVAGRAFYGDSDFPTARREVARAIALNPSNAEAHQLLAAWYSAQGRHAAALRSLERALELDPLSPAVTGDVCWLHLFARRWREAAAGAERTLELDPRDPYVYDCLVAARVGAGDPEAALAAAARAVEAESRRLAPMLDADTVAARRRFDELRAGGTPEEAMTAYRVWRLALSEAVAVHPEGYVPASELAVLHGAMGQRRRALDELERAVATDQGWRRVFLAVDPELDTLHGEPRFERLVSAVRGS